MSYKEYLSWVPGWSIEEMKERTNFAEEEDAEEMKRWRSLNQSEMDLCWKNLAEKIDEEVLDKYKVEESKRGAPLEWRRVRKNKRCKIRKWREDCWARICPRSCLRRTEKAWIHARWEDTMQKWSEWLEHMKKKDEK